MPVLKSTPDLGELLRRLGERGSVGLDRSPADPVDAEAHAVINELITELALMRNNWEARFTQLAFHYRDALCSAEQIIGTTPVRARQLANNACRRYFDMLNIKLGEEEYAQ